MVRGGGVGEIVIGIGRRVFEEGVEEGFGVMELFIVEGFVWVG